MIRVVDILESSSLFLVSFIAKHIVVWIIGFATTEHVTSFGEKASLPA